MADADVKMVTGRKKIARSINFLHRGRFTFLLLVLLQGESEAAQVKSHNEDGDEI